MPEPGSTRTLRLNAAPINAALAEIFAAINVLDEIPKDLRGALGGLFANLSDELTITEDPAASSAGELVLRFWFIPGGRFERCLTAARALRGDVADLSGHEGLPSGELDGRTPDSMRGERAS